MITGIIILYSIGIFPAYAVARTFVLDDEDWESIALSMVIAIMWPAFLAVGSVGAIVTAIITGIGWVLEFLLRAVKNLLTQLMEKHNGKS